MFMNLLISKRGPSVVEKRLELAYSLLLSLITMLENS